MAENIGGNDPDFTLCRSLETADDPDQQKIRFCAVFNDPEHDKPFAPFSLGNETLVRAHENELKVLLSFILVSSGAIDLSDNMLRLNEKGLELARKIVSAEHGKPGIPVDMFDANHTRTWVQQMSKGYRVLLINRSDSPKERIFDSAAYNSSGKAFDFGAGKRFRLKTVS
ncbi:MAG: hypothetical protein L6W00_30455 [Lentisphaeria bacterium]|nr:MAG: hypothetical protein L6W00_30455 [Lentisphaeria bacterium]